MVIVAVVLPELQICQCMEKSTWKTFEANLNQCKYVYLCFILQYIRDKASLPNSFGSERCVNPIAWTMHCRTDSQRKNLMWIVKSRRMVSTLRSICLFKAVRQVNGFWNCTIESGIFDIQCSQCFISIDPETSNAYKKSYCTKHNSSSADKRLNISSETLSNSSSTTNKSDIQCKRIFQNQNINSSLSATQNKSKHGSSSAIILRRKIVHISLIYLF